MYWTLKNNCSTQTWVDRLKPESAKGYFIANSIISMGLLLLTAFLVVLNQCSGSFHNTACRPVILMKSYLVTWTTKGILTLRNLEVQNANFCIPVLKRRYSQNWAIKDHKQYHLFTRCSNIINYEIQKHKINPTSQVRDVWTRYCQLPLWGEESHAEKNQILKHLLRWNWKWTAEGIQNVLTYKLPHQWADHKTELLKDSSTISPSSQLNYRFKWLKNTSLKHA